MCVDNRCYTPGVVEEMQEIARQCIEADKQLLRDFKKILVSPGFQIVRSEPQYASLSDISIINDLVTEAAKAVCRRDVLAGLVFRAEEFVRR